MWPAWLTYRALYLALGESSQRVVRRESENKDGNRPLRRFASQYARTEGLDVRVEGGEHLTLGFNAAAKSGGSRFCLFALLAFGFENCLSGANSAICEKRNEILHNATRNEIYFLEFALFHLFFDILSAFHQPLEFLSCVSRR